MSAQPGQGPRMCHMCGNSVPRDAQYCPSCGARLAPVADDETQSFEEAIASVLGDESESETTGSPSTPPAEPAPWPSSEPVSATPPPPQGWATQAQAEPTGWSAYPMPQQASTSGRNRTLWIVLSIFGFITFCCCGAVFVSVAVA